MTDTIAPSTPDEAAQNTVILGAQELATLVAAKLCHDFISPSGAIVSGLDLMRDPSAQDMREDALGLIEASARKMVSLVHFARVAFGAATTSERFTARELHDLVSGMTDGARAKMNWCVQDQEFSKPQARALINLAYMTMGALPMGGEATIQTRHADGSLFIEGFAQGNRVRLKPEAVSGLRGERQVDGLQGQWIQPYWLWLTVKESGGALHLAVEEGRAAIVARMPA